MKKNVMILFAILMLAPAACATADRYPVSGEKCGPDDPVKSIDPAQVCPPTT